MLKSDSQFSGTQMSPSTKSAILVIGGGEDKVDRRKILHEFFHRAGASDASIAIIPSASREPTVVGDRYRGIFEDMGAKQVKVLDIRERSEEPQFTEYIGECSGVFLTGGDQVRLGELLADTPLIERVRRRVQLGEMTLAGTSAGAAVMGHHMIAGGSSGEFPNRSLVEMAMGLSMIPEVIVDQHFHNRNRLARLISAIAMHPDRLGVGIDEDTCAIFERNGLLRVMGQGTVTIIDPQKISSNNHSRVDGSAPLSLHNLGLEVLCHGDCYHLLEGRAISPEYVQESTVSGKRVEG